MPSIDDLMRNPGMVEKLMAAGADVCGWLANELGVPVQEAARQLAQWFEMPFLGAHQLLRLEPAFDAYPLILARRTRAVVVHTRADDGQLELTAVCANPFDSDLLARVESSVCQPVTCALAAREDIEAYLDQLEAKGLQGALIEGAQADGAAAEPDVLSISTLSESDGPAVRLLNSIIYDALRSAASDIHLEMTPSGLLVKYRIDGVLDTASQPSGRGLAEQLVSRLKVLSGLDIGERRVPQDGSFRVQAQGRVIDLRVSIMPSVLGEDAVIRILDKQAIIESQGQLTLDVLGFDAASLTNLRRLTQAPHGLLLVTGPTGSGKTTTLYAALSESFTGHEKIITIEDPVEYQLTGVLQIPVNEKKGLTFARGLRSVLRHDPDKIMVGEIRDRDTAEIALQAALTGHTVLSTVHANSVFDVFGRFAHMGLDPYALSSALNGVWAQRLLRVVCKSCREPALPSQSDLASIGIEHMAADDRFSRGRGCSDCRGTGYRGRRAICEVLSIDDELREMISNKEPLRKLKEASDRQGMRSLGDAARDMARRGETTVEEVQRVVLSA